MICLLYTYVLAKSDPFRQEPLPFMPSAMRFLNAYRQFKPKLKHDLCIVGCGGEVDALFEEVATFYRRYDGDGYDCGAYQAVGSKLKYDLVLGLNSHVFFWRDGWLEAFAKAYDVFGPGVYGASGSYERNRHIRTPAIAFSPELMRKYPVKIDSRVAAEEAEGGPMNFTVWAQEQRKPTIVVAADGCYSLSRIRAIQNGFRRGDQSNMLILDRHSELYRNASLDQRRHLEQVVYGPSPEPANL